MRIVFSTYVVLILLGLAVFTVLGLLHR